jgi:hypothetical protein
MISVSGVLAAIDRQTFTVYKSLFRIDEVRTPEAISSAQLHH